jgi:hypothetical protein
MLFKIYNITRIKKFNVVSKKTKLRFWDLKCRRCPIDDIGVFVYLVMALLNGCQKFSHIFLFLPMNS